MFWLLIGLVAAARTEDAQDAHQESQVQDLPREIRNIQVPTAPYPARRMGFQLGRAQPSDRMPPEDQLTDMSPNEPKEYQDLFGPEPPLGPYPKDQLEFTRPQTPGYQGPKFFPPQMQDQPFNPQEQSFELLTPRGQGILDGPPELRSQVLNWSNRPPMPFIPQGQAVYPGGPRQGAHESMVSWYRAPMANAMGAMGPMAMGPYSQRRLKPMRFSNFTIPTSPAPLRDIELTTQSFDKWLDAQERERKRPARGRHRKGRGRRPRQEHGPLAPPQGLRSCNNDSQPKELADEYSKEGVPVLSREKGYVRPKTRPTFVIRGLFSDFTDSTTPSPPPLLRANDEVDGLQEAAPESDNGSSMFSVERKLLPFLPKEKPNTFDNILKGD